MVERMGLMKRFAGALLVGLTTALAGTSAQALEVQEVTSPGGIQAWLVEDHSNPVVGISFAFAGGASQDPAGKPGVANLASGLLDEGASWLDSKTFQGLLDEYSIELSYEAGRDTFRGSLRTLTENLDQAKRLVRLSLTSPRFDPEPVERIREQILASIRRDERNPGSVAGTALMEAAFPNHPYGRPVDGTLETVAAITVDDLKLFHAKTIAKSDLTVSVVGDIDAPTLEILLDEVFGSLPIKANLNTVRDTRVATDNRVDIDMAIPQTNIRFIAPGLKRDDPKFIDAFVASFILGGGGFGSRLFDEIREERGLAYGVSLGLGALDGAGVVSGGTSTRADQADEVLALLESEIQRYADEGPTAEELEEAKAYLTGSYPLRFTTSRSIANQLLFIQLDDLGIDYFDKRNGLIEALTLDDVKAAAKRLFAEGGLTIVRVGPQT